MSHLAQKIIIADDHPLFRAALEQAVMQLQVGASIVEAASLPELQAVMEQHDDADLILLDLNMPGAHGFSGLLYLRSHFPHIAVMVVSACEDPAIMCQSIDHQAAGFISKSASLEEIAKAIEEVLHGNIYLPKVAREHQHRPNSQSLDIAKKMASLTPQQFRVLAMVTDGLLNKQIAYDLDVSEATVKAHITSIFKKLGVRTRTQAALAVSQLNFSETAEDGH